jgi:hypothetical protein
MDREVFVNTAQACNKVLLKRANGAFGSIALVHTWGSELEGDMFVMHEVLQDGGALIVQTLELRTETGRRQGRVFGFVRN